MTIEVVLLNEIIADDKYKGLCDFDPRIEELGNSLVARMTPHFSEEVIAIVKQAGKSCMLKNMEAAIEAMYDYADAHDIWLGGTDDPS